MYIMLVLILAQILVRTTISIMTMMYLRPVRGCTRGGWVIVPASVAGLCCLGLLTFVLLFANSSLIVWGRSGSNLTPCCKREKPDKGEGDCVRVVSALLLLLLLLLLSLKRCSSLHKERLKDLGTAAPEGWPRCQWWNWCTVMTYRCDCWLLERTSAVLYNPSCYTFPLFECTDQWLRFLISS